MPQPKLANLSSSPGVTLHPVNERSTSSSQRPSPHFRPSFLSRSSLPTPPPRPSPPRTTSLPPRPHGLALDPSQFPLLDPTSSYPIRALSAAQFAQVHKKYADTAVEEQVLFPWLHGGADVPYSSASQYFGFPRGEAAGVPSYRGLTTLHAHSTPSPASSSSSLSDLANSHSLLVSSLPASTVLSPHQTFNFSLPSATVSLRTFSHQPAKYASVSDIVVYGPKGADDEVVEVAKQCVEAIDTEWCRRGRTGERYNVFVVTDPFSSFEEDYPHLVAIASDGFARNKLDFHEREREEMRVLTEASEIAPNIFLGNIADLPVDHPDGNPHAFAICVEAHDSAHLADVVTLRAHATFLDELEDESRSTLSSSSDSLSSSLILTPHASDVVHLSCLSTIACLSPSARTTILHQIVALAIWLRDQATPPPRFGRLSRRVLLYCADGYSETSLLALTCVMLEKRCNAPEAYLYLQLEAERSFFVYPRDVETVVAVERKVKEVLEMEDREAKAGGETMARSDSGFVEGPDMEERREKAVERPRMRLSTPMMDPWFYAPTFEGHFPSRILPFLYLGNLAHASNALMLRALGITHVVSMGESALNPPSQSFSSLSLTSKPTPPNSLWLEERLGNISVLDMQNIADDGMDSIRPYVDQALEYMEGARRSGGRILVHCRVGVSRSATIVIAYLMKHVQLDLASAYLLTRSRRLNILIQPNLPFAATLHAFEAELIKEKEARSEGEEEEQLGRAGLKRSNRLAWSSLSHEIALLNERFLCCTFSSLSLSLSLVQRLTGIAEAR